MLKAQFHGVELATEIHDVKRLPAVDVISAGFPCQDLSVAGKRAGIAGSRSGLVQQLLRLLATKKSGKFRWLDRAAGKILPIVTGTAFINAEATQLLDDKDPFCWGIR